MSPLWAAALLAAMGVAPASAQDPRDGKSDQSLTPPGWLVPTEVLDRSLPAWLKIDGQYRSRLEGFGGIGFGREADHHDLSQLRVRLTLRPTEWLQFLGETQDARIFGNRNVRAGPPYQNEFDLRQAYVRLKEGRDGWLDVVVGRQSLTFGEERLIGPSDWVNQGRTFDVVRLDLHHAGFGLSLFASSVVIARDGVVDHHLDGNNLHGAYGSVKIANTRVEPYVLWRVAPASVRLNENAGRGALNEITAGARVEGTVRSLQYDVEMAKQTGSLGSGSIDSWAGHWNVAKGLGVRLQPRVFIEANYASGTRNPAGRTWSTFDQLYPSNHDKLGFADQVGWRNIEQVRAGVSESAGRRWKFTETYENFWLACPQDALYTSSGAPLVRSPGGAAGRHVGQEIDGWVEWNWRKVLEAGLGYARFVTGGFLNRTTPGGDFHYPFIFLTYRFTEAETKK